jgi:ABC-type uncharacterized transport system ATPase subunit
MTFDYNHIKSDKDINKIYEEWLKKEELKKLKEERIKKLNKLNDKSK